MSNKIDEKKNDNFNQEKSRMKNNKCGECGEWVMIKIPADEKPKVAPKGKVKARKIKNIFDMDEKDTLIQVFSDGRPPKKYADDDDVQLDGCESFMSSPPCASNSSVALSEELKYTAFQLVLGSNPQIVEEAGTFHLIFHEFPLGENGRKVKMLLEWPFKKRLFFSELIPTPVNSSANWAYRNVRLCGETWQGVSLDTQATTPLDTLVSLLKGIVW